MYPARTILYRSAAIRRDGRVLAVGTSRGVALWDLAHGAELVFLPIGSTQARDLRAVRRLAYRRVDRRAAVARSARPRPGRISHRPTAPAPVASGRLRRLPRTGWADRGAGPTMTLPSSRLPSGRSMWGRWTTAATSPSARTANGWRPAVTLRRRERAGLVHRRRHQGGRAAGRLWHRGRLQPRWEMAHDDHARPAGSGRSAPGARRDRSAAKVAAFLPTAA